jgi:formylmethanofuran dehydrogenase subunit B
MPSLGGPTVTGRVLYCRVMTAPAVASEFRDVTCPFCGLTCDDLTIAAAGSRLAVRENGCPIATAAFERAPASMEVQPRIRGGATTSAAAVAEAARLLRGSRQPLFAGLGTDVAGTRAIARVADRCGGVVDHMNSAAMQRNVRVVQDTGWVTTTLSEVRNRADLVIIAGSDVGRRFPRFFERCIEPEVTLFAERRRCEVVFLGSDPAAVQGRAPTLIPCAPERLGEAFAIMRALLAGRPVQSSGTTGVPLSSWSGLVERLRAARYGVVVWAAADFEFPHAELTIQMLCELIKDLNCTTRCSGLPLGGSDADLTAESVLLWQSGFGTRTAYGQGRAEYDPYHFSTARLLRRGEADLMVWVSSFSETRLPPRSDVPTIVLGRAGMVFEEEPAVYIPVGTPGIDHAGHLFRADRVVAVPLRGLRASHLPSVAQAIDAIDAAL